MVTRPTSIATAASRRRADMQLNAVVALRRRRSGSVIVPGATPSAQRELTARLAAYETEQLERFEIASDRIKSDATLVQEFCLTRTIARTPNTLVAEAVWHEDVADPGDASLVVVRLRRDGDVVHMSLSDNGDPGETPLAPLRRK